MRLFQRGTSLPILSAAVLSVTACVGATTQLAPLPPGSSPTRLPAEDITGDDLTEVRFQLVLRGYKMSEVDWVMRRLGVELDELRARVAELEQRERERENSPEASP